MKSTDVTIIKKDGTREEFDFNKILTAINKSASRVLADFTEEELDGIRMYVEKSIDDNHLTEIPISTMHNIVEGALENVNPEIANSYRSYRNYKIEFVDMMNSIYEESQRIMFLGDKENSNLDSSLVSTKRCLIQNELSRELYKKFHMNAEERQACKDGYIYIHDQSSRRDTFNCCLFRTGEVLKGGFEMGNLWYNEPKTLDTAFDVMGDVILASASQQYGGHTTPEVDKILEPYATKSYMKYVNEYIDILCDDETRPSADIVEKAYLYAMKKVERDFEQGFQGWEYKFNTVSSSRGDYPFIAMSFGLGTGVFARMATQKIMEVRMHGQGKDGHKRPVLFPKLTFLYDENLHGEGQELNYLFELAIECSSKAMYPDMLSLTGEGYIPSIYKKYGKVISLMGCRASLSPWFERGGMYPADENDVPVFEGRFNIGAVSLHLPMILQKSRVENKDFYEVLDYYLEMIRKIHCKTYDYLGKMKASINPLAFCEGGLYGGNLKYNEPIEPLLKSATASFGITALNELQMLYNGKSLVEDGEFALEVMKYINEKVEEFKKEDHHLYAIYGTPAESLCGKQITQFRNKYGVIKGVSDRAYVSNSFHCHVTEDISPIEKQDKEERFWNYFNGGKIQYCRYPIDYNLDAIRTIVLRGMKKGFYQGINLSLSYCDDCGYSAADIGDVCPKCGSTNLTKIDRMNGYLSYSRVRGDSRLNDAKMAEIKDRVSM